MENKITETKKRTRLTSEVIELYNANVTIKNIALKFNAHEVSIQKYLRKNGAIKNKNRKSTDEIDTEIVRLYTKELYSAGQIQDLLKDKINLTPGGIIKILKKNGVEIRGPEDNKNARELDKHILDVIDTEEKAYFLGYFYADGYNVKGGKALKIELQASDAEMLKKFQSLFFKNDAGNIQYYTRLRKGKEYYSAVLNLNSKHLSRIMDKHGAPNAKTFLIRFPNWMPRHLVRHFVRGYFDGDGSIWVKDDLEKRQWKITSNDQFINDVKQIILDHIGIETFIQKHHISVGISNLSQSSKDGALKILEWLYKDATIFLERKKDKYLLLEGRNVAK